MFVAIEAISAIYFVAAFLLHTTLFVLSSWYCYNLAFRMDYQALNGCN